VPAPLAAVVMRCLEKRPADRWQSAAEVLAQLEAVTTPGGGALATSPLTARPEPRQTPKRALAIAGAAMVVLAVGYLIARVAGWGSSSGSSGSPPVLAVLPFENLGEPADEYFADGMTDEITGRLTRLSGLAVIARTSAIQYKKTTKSTKQISQELGAQYLLEGTVRWEKSAAGSQVRISPQLIRTSDGVNVWSESYEEPYGTAIFAMQAAIAERVAGAMSVTLLAAEQRAVANTPTRNLEAYDYYLRGRQYVDRSLGERGWEAARIAVDLFEKAVAADSGFALALGWLAQAHRNMRSADLSLSSGMPAARRGAMVVDAANRALRIQPDLPVAHSVLADYFESEGDSTAAARERALLLRSQPSDAPAALANGKALSAQGKNPEAVAAFEHAVSLDPRSAPTVMSAAFGLWGLGRLDASERLYQRATELLPSDPTPYLSQAWFHLLTGSRPLALDDLRRGVANAGLEKLVVELSKSEWWNQMVRVFDREYGDVFRRLPLSAWGLDTADYLFTRAMAYRATPTSAAAYWDSLAMWTAARLALEPDNLGFLSIRAMALAGAGRKAAALQALRALPASLTSGDARGAAQRAAKGFVLAGDFDAAIARLEALSTLGFAWAPSPGILEADPIWDPLRQNPRFQKLLQRK
jgi:serine/threonine-protein kinase